MTGIQTMNIEKLIDEIIGGYNTSAKIFINQVRSNVTICLMVQSLVQLDEIYGEKARRTIVDNCHYKAILGTTDADSQKYFSNLIGTCEVEKESHGV